MLAATNERVCGCVRDVNRTSVNFEKKRLRDRECWFVNDVVAICVNERDW